MTNISFREGFTEASFCFSLEKVEISKWWGFGYSIPDMYWRVEQRYPTEYEVNKFDLRTFQEPGRSISWAEIDIELHMETGIIPVGWRALRHMLQDQIFIPMKWLEHLSGGQQILFPYALGERKDRSGGITPCCPLLFLGSDGETLGCKPVSRYTQAATTAIAVYQR